MNLTRMRTPVFRSSDQLTNSKHSWNRDLLIPLYHLRIKDMFGDQNLINTIFHYNPGWFTLKNKSLQNVLMLSCQKNFFFLKQHFIFTKTFYCVTDLLYYLPCRFNYQHKFCFDNYKERECASAEKDGAFVIHGSANTFYNNYAPAFRAINDVITQVNSKIWDIILFCKCSLRCSLYLLFV